MLKEITIENYRGICEQRSISFLANSKRKKDKYAVVKQKEKEILLTTALMGKNGSGKSSFIQGIHFFEVLCSGSLYENILVRLQRRKEKKEENVLISFEEVIDEILQEEFNNPEKPIKFTMAFIDNKIELEIKVVFNNDGLIEEKIYENEILILEQKISLKDFTSQLHTKYKGLKRVSFFKIDDSFEQFPISRILKIKNSKNLNKKTLLEWSKIADSKIYDLEVENVSIKSFWIENEQNHKKKINHSQLSDGTLKWTNLAVIFIFALRKTQTFVFIDEIERSLHPGLVKFLINIFASTTINKKRSQLLFTTHSPSILDQDFRKDAINYIDDQGIINIGNDLNVREDIIFSKNYYAEKLANHPDKNQMLDFLESLESD